jgi:lipopolysaccharide export LptBFGC system permease protein LptF
MELDPLETVESARAAAEARDRRLNAAVAITVAILATFMGVCKVKDDNIVQAMQQAQADKLDHWAYYQARTIRHDVAQSTVLQLELARLGRLPAERATYDEAIAKQSRLAAEQLAKRDELKLQAEQDQKNYDALNYRDDQFDLSDALLAIAIALLAVTALTRLWWLYWISIVPTGFGVLMGLAGLIGWNIHPDLLIRLLS